ncbi:MAG: PH domain-containing protein [bacterium]
MNIVSFDGQKEGEKIISLWRGHVFIMTRAGFIFAAIILIGSIPLAYPNPSWADQFLIVFICVGVFYLLLQIYLYISTIYILTNERILSIDQSKLFMRSINELPLHNIQNVSHTKKGLFQMMFDFGIVEIQTSGSGTAMRLKNVPHPYLVQQKILDKEERIKNKE